VLQLLRMAEPVREDPEIVKVGPLGKKAVELVGHLPIARGHRVEFQMEGEPPICQGHATQLLQVFINLLTNSLEACGESEGCVVLSAALHGDVVIVGVGDGYVA